MIRISEVEQVFRDIFDEENGLVKSVDTVYESASSGNYVKLIISLHGLSIDDVSVIHTKFIFKVDNNKRNLISKDFIYLYNINCNYRRVTFDSVFDLSKKIEDIIKSNDYGRDLQILSDFIEAPAMFLNYYMRKHDITDYSVFNVTYEPKFKNTPCEDTTFDFDINVNNSYKINLSIRKIESTDEEEMDVYNFQFKFMDEIKTVSTDSIKNIHFFIGSNIAKILDSKLKKIS